MWSDSCSRVLVVIVAAGQAERDLRTLLESVRSECVLGLCSIAIVDNGCTTNLAGIPLEFDKTTVRRPSRNLGYGGAVNEAVSNAHLASDWILVCNADLIFPRGCWGHVRRLAAQAPADIGCIAPRLLNEQRGGGGIQGSVGRFPSLASLLAGRVWPRPTRKYIPSPRTAQDVDWATGACLLVRRSAFESVGGFDSEFFLDYEDVDFCRRLWNSNWRVRFDPSWEVIHTGPNAMRPISPTRHVHTRQSLVRYWAKHRPAWEFHALGGLLRATSRLRSDRHPLMPAWQAGAEAYGQLARARRKDGCS